MVIHSKTPSARLQRRASNAGDLVGGAAERAADHPEDALCRSVRPPAAAYAAPRGPLDCNAERFCVFEADDQLEFRGLLPAQTAQ